MPVQIAEATADHEQRGDRQRITRNDPLHAGEIGLELTQDRRDRDVQNCVVENRDRYRGDRDRGRDPPLRIKFGAIGSRCDQCFACTLIGGNVNDKPDVGLHV
jgi:hypothetical protein